MSELTVLDVLLMCVFGGFMLFALTRGSGRLHGRTLDTAAKLSVYWSNAAILWLAAIAVGVAWLAPGRPAAEIGLTLHHKAPGWGIAIAVGFVVLWAIDAWFEASTVERRAALMARFRRDVPFIPETRREFAHCCVLGTTAGITEEVIFRGYLIACIMTLTGDSLPGTVTAIAVPALGFAVIHLYQGWKAVARITLLGVSYGAIVVITGSLLMPILLHIAVDVVGAAMAVWAAEEQRRDGRSVTAPDEASAAV